MWYDDISQYDKPVETFPLPKNACATVVNGSTTMDGWKNGAWRDSDRFRISIDNRPMRRFVYNPNWGLIMSSTGMCCIDIDDHDGNRTGFKSIERFNLPPTLAKISRSGKGRHLYYKMPDGLPAVDLIGILDGVDFKAYGLTFFVKDVTLWNGLEAVELPQYFAEGIMWRINQKNNSQSYVNSDVKEKTNCPALCNSAIPIGQRNNMLYAWGYGLAKNGWTNWQEHVQHRGLRSGLDMKEIEQITRSIKNGI